MTDVSRTGDSPFAQWQRVTITFGEPDTDTAIAHDLLPAHPDEIKWFVISSPVDAVIYRGGAKEWGRNYILLRSSVAPCSVDLLLVVLQ